MTDTGNEHEMFSASWKSAPKYDLYITDNLKYYFVTSYWFTGKNIKILGFFRKNIRYYN